jgi:hypothetical protein
VKLFDGEIVRVEPKVCPALSVMLVGMKLVGRLEKKLLRVTVPWKPFRLLKVTLAVPMEP